MTANAPIALDKSLDGARVLYRNWMVDKPVDGWIREFSPNGEYVRIARTMDLFDAGVWHRCLTLRVDAVLDPARVTKPAEQPVAGGTRKEDEGHAAV